MKLKKIVLVLILVLLTGCTAEYNLYINEDLSIDESIYIKETKENLMESYEETEGDLESMLQNQINELRNIKENEYGILTTPSDSNNNYMNSITSNYKNFTEYKNNVKLNKIFSNFSVIENEDGKINIIAENINKSPYNDVDTFIINISSKYNITNSNATTKDSHNNIYMWKFENAQKPSLNLTIDTKEKFTEPYKKEIIEKNTNTKTIIIVISCFVILILGISIFLLSKFKKNNKI